MPPRALLPAQVVSVSSGLEGYDLHLDSLTALFEQLQLLSVDAADPSLDVLSFSQSVDFFGIITVGASRMPGSLSGPPLSTSHLDANFARRGLTPFRTPSPIAEVQTPYFHDYKPRYPVNDGGVNSLDTIDASPNEEGTQYDWNGIYAVDKDTYPRSTEQQYGTADLPPLYSREHPNRHADTTRSLTYQRIMQPRTQMAPFTLGDLTDDYPVSDTTPRPIGIIYLASSNTPWPQIHHGRNLASPEVNVGLVLDVEYRGLGYGTEALKLVLKHGFNDLGCHRIQAPILNSTYAKDKVHELFIRAHFQYEGVRRLSFYSLIEEEWKNVTYFAIILLDYATCQFDRLPEPRTVWDEMFLRHQREREEMMKHVDEHERQTRRLFRSSSHETIRCLTDNESAQPAASHASESDSSVAMSEPSSHTSLVGKGKDKALPPDPFRAHSPHKHILGEFDSDEDSDLDEVMARSRREVGRDPMGASTLLTSSSSRRSSNHSLETSDWDVLASDEDEWTSGINSDSE